VPEGNWHRKPNRCKKDTPIQREKKSSKKGEGGRYLILRVIYSRFYTDFNLLDYLNYIYLLIYTYI